MSEIMSMNTEDQGNRLLTFRLHGDFAHFNQPIGNRFRNTYSIVPKPQLLGIVGAIIGLRGYTEKFTAPDFYRLLKDIKVFIKPNNFYSNMFTVKYNSLNSFLNNRLDTGSPNVIIEEQILLKPDYEIGLLLNKNKELHNTIIERIKHNSCVFNPYLGKNEFPACIECISLRKYEINTKKEVMCQSILPFDVIEDSDGNMRVDTFPVGFDDNFKYIYHTMAIPRKGCIISLKSPNDCIVSKGKTYYVY